MYTKILNATLLLLRISAEALKVNVIMWFPQKAKQQAKDLRGCSLLGAGARKRTVKQERRKSQYKDA